MFKKKDPRATALANRINAISGHEVPEENEYVDTRIRKGNRAEREATYKQATVQMRTGERLAVVVKNVSKTGARIEFFTNVPLSDVVYLMEPTLNIRCWCDVVWEREGVAGLRFIPG